MSVRLEGITFLIVVSGMIHNEDYLFGYYVQMESHEVS